MSPGAETLVDVEVKDVNGQGVAGTDTAVIVVDESVLALANYKLADPLSYFYSERSESVNDFHLREKVTLANPEEVKRLVAAGGDVNIPSVQSLPVNGRNFANLLGQREMVDSLNASRSVMETVTVTRQRRGDSNIRA